MYLYTQILPHSATDWHITALLERGDRKEDVSKVLILSRWNVQIRSD